MTDELTPSERDALDTWAPMTPPPAFADRVLAARDATAPTARKRWPLVAGLVATTTAAAAIAFVMLRAPSHAAQGELVAQTTRTTKLLGDRAVAVAEPQATFQWRIDDDGDAVIEQRAGDVFYRVNRGGSFVVHTPAGDVRVTGTCFRIEVTMNRTKQLLLSGTVGAAIATGVVVTVYEGHVVADSKSGNRAEIAAGHRAMFSSDGRAVVDDSTPTIIALDDPNATREQLVARTHVQQTEIEKLRARVAALESTGDNHGDHETGEDGRAWHDPSPERLKEWAASCHIRNDAPDIDRWKPATDLGKNERGLEPAELPQLNAVLAELQKQWKQLVRALYIEATGDMQGADSLSTDAMRREIEEKSAPEERGLLLQRIAQERAGMLQPPTDLSKATPFERLFRAWLELGDKTEAAIAKRLGAERAKAIRGEGWDWRSDMSGCPSKD